MNNQPSLQAMVWPLSSRAFLPAIALTLVFAFFGAWMGY